MLRKSWKALLILTGVAAWLGTLLLLHAFGLLAVAALLLPVLLIVKLRGLRDGLLIANSAALASLFLYLTGLYRSPTDVLDLVGMSFLLLWILRKRQNHWILARSRPILDYFRASTLLAICTLFSWWVGQSLPSPSNVPGTPVRNQEERSERKHSDVHVALALSGGGYRAALMHAGVLDAAQHFGLHITHLSTVSGGSIIGSYYAAGGSPRDFLKIVEHGSLDFRRELIRLPNLLRLPWHSFSRSDIEANLIDAVLLHGRSLADASSGDRPKLLVCATDLHSGAAYGFTSEGMITRPPLALPDKHPYRNAFSRPDFASSDFRQFASGMARRIRLSRVVAASGAFPLAFAPVSIETDFMQFDKPFRSPLLLADGGVADNSGLDLILDMQRESGDTVPILINDRGVPWPAPKDWQFEYLISSDASALFSPFDQASVGVSRALDIVYRNVRSRERQPPVYAPRPFLLSPEHYAYTLPRGQDSNSVHKALLLETSQFSFLPEEIIDYLLDNLPSDDEYTVAQAARDDRRQKDRFLASLRKNLSQPGPRSLIGITLATQMEECLGTFARTSTLQDQMSKSQARQLFRLGQYLFALNWPLMRAEIESAEENITSSEQILSDLTKVTQIKPAPMSIPERAMLDFETPDLRSNGPVFGYRDVDDLIRSSSQEIMLGKPSNESLIAMTKLYNMHAACVAHRLAHVVANAGPFRSRQLPSAMIPVSSLIEELRNNVEINSGTEDKVDQLTTELLCKAGIAPQGFPQLMEEILDRYGSRAVEKGLQERLQRAKRLAVCSPASSLSSH